MKKYYLVVETVYEYNDEYYNSSDGVDIDKDKSLYDDKSKAVAEYNSRIEKLFYDHTGKFSPSCFDFFDYAAVAYYDDKVEKLKTYIDSISQTPCDKYRIQLPDTATVEQCLKAYKISGLQLYKIMEVNIN